MRAIPYLQREGVGVHMASDAVHVVEVVVWRGDVRVRRADSERIGQDGARAALARLAKRARLRGRWVHASSNPDTARARVVDVPDFEDAEDTDAWLLGQERKLASEGYVRDPKMASSVRLPGTDSRKALIVSELADPIRELEEALAEAGLEPLRIGSGLVEGATSVFAFDADAATASERVAILIAGAEGSTLVVVQAGQIQDATWSQGAAADVVGEGHVVLPDGGRTIVTGTRATEAIDAIIEVYGAGRVRRAELPAPARHEHATALGLALEAAGAWPEGIDFLLAPVREAAEAEREKQTAQRAILMIGMTILLLLGLAEGASAWFGHQLTRAEAENALRSGDIAAVDNARAEVERLRRDVAAARAASRDQSQVSTVLERLGRAVPEGAWLAETVVEDAEIRVTGFALAAEGVQRYVAALEADPLFQDVRLLRITRRDADRSLPQAVIEFSIQAQTGGIGQAD